jgi:hypothetical protein
MPGACIYAVARSLVLEYCVLKLIIQIFNIQCSICNVQVKRTRPEQLRPIASRYTNIRMDSNRRGQWTVDTIDPLPSLMLVPLLGQIPSFYRIIGSCGKRRFRGSQPKDQFRHFFRFSQASQRMQTDQVIDRGLIQ